MKRNNLLLSIPILTLTPTLTLLLLLSCQKPPSGPASYDVRYPEALIKVLDAHGGLQAWRKMQALTFDIVEEEGNETHTIDLHKRWDRIDAPTHSMGYDGTELWLKADTSYKGRPAFSHNLMFYFFAMPFVLADEGITYSVADTIIYKDQSYPGIKIAFNEGVGASSLDEYILYYDPETYQMTWLAYTATYFVQEKRTSFNWIHYQDWITVDGLLLPETLQWHKKSQNRFSPRRDPVTFDQVKLSSTPHDLSVFKRPEGAEVVE